MYIVCLRKYNLLLIFFHPTPGTHQVFQFSFEINIICNDFAKSKLAWYSVGVQHLVCKESGSMCKSWFGSSCPPRKSPPKKAPGQKPPKICPRTKAPQTICPQNQKPPDKSPRKKAPRKKPPGQKPPIWGAFVLGGFFRGLFSGGFCPGAFVRGLLTWGFCPGAYVQFYWVNKCQFFHANFTNIYLQHTSNTFARHFISWLCLG